jgi:hypothetical protein
VGVVLHGLWHERRFGRRGWKLCGGHLRGGKVAGLQGGKRGRYRGGVFHGICHEGVFGGGGGKLCERGAEGGKKSPGYRGKRVQGGHGVVVALRGRGWPRVCPWRNAARRPLQRA